jgi:hypothetical protein
VIIPFTGCCFFFEGGQMESFSYYELIDEPIMPAHVVPKEQVLNKVKHEKKMVPFVHMTNLQDSFFSSSVSEHQRAHTT